LAGQALQILGRGWRDLWDNLLVMIAANLIWAVTLLPGLGLLNLGSGLLASGLGLILIVLLAGPATLALYNLTLEVTRRERIELGDFWQGLRQYYRRGWVVALLNLAFGLLALLNLNFYLSPDLRNSPLSLGIILWGYITFAWFCMQLYLWPMAIRTEQFRLDGLLRNAFLATFKYPALSLIIGLATGLFFLIATLAAFLPIILFGMGYYALVSNHALRIVLQKEQARVTAMLEQQAERTTDTRG
jgi:hypothetical protein